MHTLFEGKAYGIADYLAKHHDLEYYPNSKKGGRCTAMEIYLEKFMADQFYQTINPLEIDVSMEFKKTTCTKWSLYKQKIINKKIPCGSLEIFNEALAKQNEINWPSRFDYHEILTDMYSRG